MERKIDLLEKRIDMIAKQQELFLSQIQKIIEIMSNKPIDMYIQICSRCKIEMIKKNGTFPHTEDFWECRECGETRILDTR